METVAPAGASPATTCWHGRPKQNASTPTKSRTPPASVCPLAAERKVRLLRNVDRPFLGRRPIGLTRKSPHAFQSNPSGKSSLKYAIPPPPSPRPIGGRRACDRTTVLPPHPMAVTCFFFNIHLVVAVVAFLLRRWLFHAIERRCVGGGRFFSLLVCGPSSQRANRDHKRDLRIEFIHLVKSRPF